MIVLELDDDLLDHLATVRGHYVLCFRDAITKAQARAGEDRVLVEVSLRAGEDALGHLIDLCELSEDGTVQPIHVVHRSFAPWREVRYRLDDATLQVGELVWFAIELELQPAIDPACVDAWFQRWQSDGFAVEPPLGGRVHYMAFEGLALHLDLGSAPVESLRDLLERCVSAGARQLSLHSAPEALAGQQPA